jgi:hypothetical protein
MRESYDRSFTQKTAFLKCTEFKDLIMRSRIQKRAQVKALALQLLAKAAAHDQK